MSLCYITFLSLVSAAHNPKQSIHVPGSGSISVYRTVTISGSLPMYLSAFCLIYDITHIAIPNLHAAIHQA